MPRNLPEPQNDQWEQDASSLSDELCADDRLLVELDGFEGPLDLLLALAREKKLDISQISIADLATQYIEYINDLKKHRLEIAADYLVMAAWLVFLKSKLILPSEEAEEESPSGDQLAAQLAFRLKRLEAMRAKGNELMARPQLGQEFFAAGAPLGRNTVSKIEYKAELFDLLKAYSAQQQRQVVQGYKVKRRQVWSIKKARNRLSSLLGMSIEWAPINELIASFMGAEAPMKTTVASTFGATLEMARDGVIEIKQSGPFQPLYVKSASHVEESSDE
ncbi:MAG: segregation and condensation protein A [Rhodomicrobiaceae bacterium]